MEDKVEVSMSEAEVGLSEDVEEEEGVALKKEDVVDLKEDAMDQTEDAEDLKEDVVDQTEDAVDLKEDVVDQTEDAVDLNVEGVEDLREAAEEDKIKQKNRENVMLRKVKIYIRLGRLKKNQNQTLSSSRANEPFLGNQRLQKLLKQILPKALKAQSLLTRICTRLGPRKRTKNLQFYPFKERKLFSESRS